MPKINNIREDREERRRKNRDRKGERMEQREGVPLEKKEPSLT